MTNEERGGKNAWPSLIQMISVVLTSLGTIQTLKTETYGKTNTQNPLVYVYNASSYNPKRAKCVQLYKVQKRKKERWKSEINRDRNERKAIIKKLRIVEENERMSFCIIWYFVNEKVGNDSKGFRSIIRRRNEQYF